MGRACEIKTIDNEQIKSILAEHFGSRKEDVSFSFKNIQECDDITDLYEAILDGDIEFEAKVSVYEKDYE